jgi:hypothetical protein
MACGDCKMKAETEARLPITSFCVHSPNISTSFHPGSRVSGIDKYLYDTEIFVYLYKNRVPGIFIETG